MVFQGLLAEVVFRLAEISKLKKEPKENVNSRQCERMMTFVNS